MYKDDYMIPKGGGSESATRGCPSPSQVNKRGKRRSSLFNTTTITFSRRTGCLFPLTTAISIDVPRTIRAHLIRFQGFL